MSFDITKVVALNPTTIRVTFNDVPRRSGNATNDATNPKNWAIAGPKYIIAEQISTVGSDIFSVDLLLSTTLTNGTFTVTGSNIKTVAGTSLTVNSISFTFSSEINNKKVNENSTNLDYELILKTLFNPIFVGKNWDALISGLAHGDRVVSEIAQAAEDQQNISTASERFLDALATNQGLSRPVDGMSDVDFRALAVVLNDKVTLQSILKVLEIFYGQNAISAHVITGNAQPFSITDGAQLNITIDGSFYGTITFQNEQFQDITNATAFEVASVITQSFIEQKIPAFALEYQDDDEKKVAIFTKTKGLKGSVSVNGEVLGGGLAQNSLLFSESLSSVYTGNV